MSGLRLVVYVRVSRKDERPENQEYAIFRWAAEMKRDFICQRIREVLTRLKAQGEHVGSLRSGLRRRAAAS
jgi:DNA invertase Pin-like site-specific DNA recombinase